MSFGGVTVPDGYVVRSFRAKVMATEAKRRQAFGLLVAGGDVWAWCIDRFHARFRAGLPNANSLTELWPDQKAHGPFRDLSAHCAQDVTKAWSHGYFEVIRRRAAGQKASLPLKKRFLAMAAGPDAVLISGRALRAEEFLHLQDSKVRQQRMSAKRAPRRARPGPPAQPGSRRWKKLAARQRRQEARNRRVVKQAANRAANLAAEFIVDRAHAGLVVIGDPKGLDTIDAGRRHNWRIHRWVRRHTRDALIYRLQECGIPHCLVDERGTSSACPDCGAAAKKHGRVLVCTEPTCRHRHHRDIAGARNMVRKAGRAPTANARTEHRRVGTPARRDRRRHLYDQTRSTKAPGPARTRAGRPTRRQSLATTD